MRVCVCACVCVCVCVCASKSARMCACVCVRVYEQVGGRLGIRVRMRTVTKWRMHMTNMLFGG